MVGIVIVSHSATLAQGVYELATQMTQGQVPIALAGGIDDPDNPIGTDAAKIYTAIETVYDEDGVVVLMDLGSAILSTEMALEFLLPEQIDNVHLCSAPLVEGTIVAAVQASIGSSITEILAETQTALAPKISQLQTTVVEKTVEENVSTFSKPTYSEQIVNLTIRNKMGIHARPAAQLVMLAKTYPETEVLIDKGNKTANAQSLNQISMLAVRQDETITVRANGPNATTILTEIEDLVADNFGETDDELLPTPDPIFKPEAIAANEMVGIAASPGIAIGPVVQYRPQLPEVPRYTVSDVAIEWQRLTQAIAAATHTLESVRLKAEKQFSSAEAAIFQAHQLFLQDPELLETAQTNLVKQQINAEAGWQQAIDQLVERYRTLDNETMQAKAADVIDIGRRVLHELLDLELPSLDFTEPIILVASDLTPSDTLHLDPTKVLGICTELGGLTAHSAILARSLGIPAIVGLNGQAAQIPAGQTIAMDGEDGRLWLAPDDNQLATLEAKQSAWVAEQMEAKAGSKQLATTQDGQTVEIVANISRPLDAKTALDFGAEGVGLFRTEFLFLERDTPPTEDEQVAAYQQVTEIMGIKPVVIRTIDVGGDKPLPYIQLETEDNPFLGWRGIRWCINTHRDLFKTHLRAILRASVGHTMKIMFPMISTLDELKAAKAILHEAQTELEAQYIPYDPFIQVGVMIEVPAAVAIAEQLAKEVDFFSIGTNDLAQYTMAADRGNTRVANLVNALQPAVLRLIQQTIETAHQADIWVGLCGELAGNPLATPLLVGLGFDELSLNAPNIPKIKTTIRNLTTQQTREIAHTALSLESANAVEVYLKEVARTV